MNHRSKGFFILSALVVLLSFSSCKNVYIQKGDIINLNIGWEYCLTNPMTDSNPDFIHLPVEKLSNLHQLVDGEHGTIWLRRSFTIPDSLKDKDLGVYLGRIALADHTYLNSSLIGGEGHFPPNEFSAWNTSRFYPMPETLLVRDGINTILIEIYVNGEGSVVSDPYIGEVNQVKYSYLHERFWNSQINAIFAFLMIVIGLYHFMIWLKHKVEMENLHFALINLITAAYMSVFYLPEIPGLPSGRMPFIVYQKIFSSALPFFLPYLIQEFINCYLHRKDWKWVVYIRMALVVVPVIAVFCAPNYMWLRKMRPFVNPMLIPPILYIVATLIIAVVKKAKDSVPLLIGFSPLALTTLIDIITHDVMQFYSLPYFSSIGWQLVIIALLFVLASRFSNARIEAEYLNVHLQDIVDERTKELTTANESLTTANEKLEEAKMVAERDMKLAVNVQQSFYPRRAPVLDDWDIAYTFRPMSGVSGDLYDFFTTGKKLDGIALFDVSGHGISSGLVTMLSKTVISRCFTKDPSVHINTIMKNINDGIVDEKGDIENYLTGLLIRTDGNKVQYINAAHPAVFFRSARTGACATVEVKDSGKSTAGSGAIIGIPWLNLDVRGIQFAMQPGDALIMYTDCLSEARNVEGEEFTQQAVSREFSASGNGDAQSKLDYVLKKFNNFTAGTELKDDLTVIVLQKK